ncbi:MAG: hypothetical protein HN390_08950 [Anaerolineae bacterium]|jgi:hypothetical protein|nr:hypothetical protein [Anaerolineae bacterium]MBT7189817.1 hypothetical protein [Anaerolineae bacterium]MBT7988683.1 hypothetical protein [Anaerolineae bacterium]
MAIFQNPLWGFELTYPDSWAQVSNLGADGFAQNVEAFDPVSDVNEQAAYMLVRGEFNGKREAIAPLWSQHISKLSIMLGAKKLGASPFSMGGANGFEAEIQLPKKTNRRLWAGILARDTIILHFMVSHKKTERANFEPHATKIISSLRFLERIENLATNADNLPLPRNYALVDPVSLIPDVKNVERWQAYAGDSELAALQAFYYRELPQHGWEISEFIPFPNQEEIGFARLRIHKDDLTATLGILPTGEKKLLGQIVVMYD